jgi:hypothetical protein
MMKDYAIQRPGKEQKGRSFRATCVAVATANSLWDEGGKDGAIRPVWAMFAGTEQELRPFVANLKSGRKAEPAEQFWRGGDNERFEFLRSVGFVASWQREAEGSLVTLFHPELFRLDPGLIEPSTIRFLLFVPSDWSDAQRVDVASAVRHVQPLAPKLEEGYLSSLVPTAYLFAAYLDRRTRAPLVADGRFYLQLLLSALDQGLASLPGRDIKYNRSSRDQWGFHNGHGFDFEMGGSSWSPLGIDSIGLAHVISFNSTHTVFEQFLAEQVTQYFARVKGKTRRGKIDLSAFAAG